MQNCGSFLRLVIDADDASPFVTFTASASRGLNAFDRRGDQLRHDEQWQKPAANGSPVTVTSTAPQKLLTLYISS